MRRAAAGRHPVLSSLSEPVQINDFAAVVRDTQRNLDLFTFVTEHTDREELSWTLQQIRPYVLMMNTRAKASIFLAQGKFGEAMIEIERGAMPSWNSSEIELSRAGLKKLGRSHFSTSGWKK